MSDFKITEYHLLIIIEKYNISKYNILAPLFINAYYRMSEKEIEEEIEQITDLEYKQKCLEDISKFESYFGMYLNKYSYKHALYFTFKDICSSLRGIEKITG